MSAVLALAAPPAHSDPYVVVDVETAGFAPSNGFLLEIALVFVADGAIIGRCARLLRPSCKWERHPAYIRSLPIHKISRQEIKQHGRPEAEVARELHELISRFADRFGTPRFVAHNASFEERWLAGEPWCFPFEVDTLPLARDLLPDLEGHKLAALVEHYGLSWEGPAHRALPDAVATAEVLLRLLAPKPAPEPAPAPRLPESADKYDVARLLAQHAPTLREWMEEQVAYEESKKGRGETADELLSATLAGLRALMVRCGGDPSLAQAVYAAVESLTGAPRFRVPRRATPKATVHRLWADEVLEPLGPADVGGATQPGVVYRRPGGGLIALTNEQIARLEVTND